MVHRPVIAVVKDIAIGAGGLGFDSQAGQIGHSVANILPSLLRFFGAVLSRSSIAEMDPVTRYTCQRDTCTASIMNASFF